jgi:hypothetical protein
MADIIKFPKPNVRKEQQTDVVENLNILDEMILDETFEVLSTSIANHIGMAGFDYSKDDETYKSFCFFMEALRSFVLRYYGKDHMLHELADTCVELEGENVIYRHINFNIIDPKASEYLSKEELDFIKEMLQDDEIENSEEEKKE